MLFNACKYDQFVTYSSASSCLLGACVLGDSLIMKEKSSLDFARGDGWPLVVGCKGCNLVSCSSNALKEVIDKWVYDVHGLGGDVSLRVALLEDLVDINSIRVLLFSVFGLLVALGNVLGILSRVLCGMLNADNLKADKQLLSEQKLQNKK